MININIWIHCRVQAVISYICIYSSQWNEAEVGQALTGVKKKKKTMEKCQADITTKETGAKKGWIYAFFQLDIKQKIIIHTGPINSIAHIIS